MAEQHHIDCLVVSADRVFVARAIRLIAAPERGLRLARDFTQPLTDLSKSEAEELRTSTAQIILLDIGDDPAVGLRLARFLSEDNPGRTFVLTGPAVATDVLLEAMRLGASEYLPRPVDEADLSAALGRATRRLGPAETRDWAPQGKVIAVYAAKGGAGATTTAANLAVELCRHGNKPTVLVDFDLEHGSTAVVLGLRPRYSVLDVVKNLHRMDRDLLASFVERHQSGLSVLASPALIGPGEAVTREQARAVLQFLRRQYEYVVVDLEKSFTTTTGAAVENADDVLMVTTPDLASLRNTKKAMPFVERSMTDPKRLHLIVNRRRTVDVITSEDVQKAIGREVFATLTADDSAVADAMNTGKPAVLSRKSHYARDVKTMAAHLLGSFSTNGKSPKPRRSLFGDRSGKTGKKKS
jgi:pilus assembly protein CpaE